MREQIPLFSGPGHVILFYFVISLIIFVPREMLSFEDIVYISGISAFLGFPLGTLINTLYFAVWDSRIGYARVGYAKRFVSEYNDIPDEMILAVFDLILWENASPEQIEYFRRRWSAYHLSAQIAIITLISLSFPFISIYFLGGRISQENIFFLVLYTLSLTTISVLCFLRCKNLEKLNYFFIRELIRCKEEEIHSELKKLKKESELHTALCVLLTLSDFNHSNRTEKHGHKKTRPFSRGDTVPARGNCIQK